jgi:hypothetical protein
MIDRQHAFLDQEVIAVVAIRRRGVRSRVFLRDGSLYETLTRPKTFRRKPKESHGRTFSQI